MARLTEIRRTWTAVTLAAWLLPAAALAQDEPTEPEPAPEAEPAEPTEAPAEAEMEAGAGMEAETDLQEPAPMEPEPMAAEPMAAPEEDTETFEAEDDDGGADDSELGSLVIGAEVGGILPFSELGPHVAIGLEVGYLLPFIDRRLEVFAAASWSPPMNDFDDDIGGTTYEGEITEQAVSVSLGPRFRFLEVGEMFNVTGAAGMRLFMLRSESNGSSNDSDESFAEFTEESLEVGVFAAVGAELVLGPGALFLDVDFGWSNLSHRISGDVGTTNVAATLGYRLFVL